MDYQTWLVDEGDEEEALNTDECIPWDLEDRLYEKWRDKKLA